MTDEKDASTFYRFNTSLWFQHEREIDAFPFGDVKATGREYMPVGGAIREERTGNRRRQNDKTGTGRAHEFWSTAPVQRCEKTLHARSKIPDQTWLLEFYRGKLHVRLQRCA